MMSTSSACCCVPPATPVTRWTALEQQHVIAVLGTSVRMLHPMLEVVAYDRLGPREWRAVHRALACVMTAPQHETARAVAARRRRGRGRRPSRAVRCPTSAGRPPLRGDLRVAAVAHDRAAAFAERTHEERSHGARQRARPVDHRGRRDRRAPAARRAARRRRDHPDGAQRGTALARRRRRCRRRAAGRRSTRHGTGAIAAGRPVRRRRVHVGPRP